MDISLLSTSAFWISVGQIILIDILLGGDNAVVIALACRKLPAEQRKKGIFWGVTGAIVLRIILIFFALQLLALPFLKLAGGLMLFWIGAQLMQGGDDDHDVAGATSLFGAIKTIIVADAVMSVDNVIAVAGAARGDIVLVAFGILVSIPIIVWGSQLVLKLMDRYPFVITIGAALLGWIGGEMIIGDQVMKSIVPEVSALLKYSCAVAGALLVVGLGTLLAKRAAAQNREDDSDSASA